MTAKQLAQRLGVTPVQLDFEFARSCAACRTTGGNDITHCIPCEIQLRVVIKEETVDKRH